MAMAFRTLITKPTSFHSILSRFFMSSSASLSVPGLSAIASRSVSSSTLLRLRPLIALSDFRRAPCSVDLRCFSSRPTTSSLNDPSPNWTNRPPKETILLDGCDFEHWLVVMDKPEGEPTRDEIIDGYIKTLAQVLGSEDEARKHIYSVSTKHYFAFGALVSEEVSLKIKELPKVRWVLPDSYLDVRNKDYGGEPFIDGQAVPYDPKYHEEWVRNNSRANERSRRNDRPRNFDRSRNFERRRENMQNRDFQSRGVPNASPPPMGGAPPNAPPPHMGGGPPNAPPPHMGGAPPNAPPPHMGGPPPHASAPHMQSNMGGMPPNASFQNAPPNMQYNAPNAGGMQPNPNMQYNAPNAGGMQPNPNMQYNAPNMQYNNPNMGGMPPRDAGPNGGFSNSMPNGGNMPNRDFQYRDAPNNGGGMPYQNNGPPGPMPNRGYQNNYAAPRNGNMEDLPSGNPYDVRNVSGRDEGY